jgi:hypothetical protein
MEAAGASRARTAVALLAVVFCVCAPAARASDSSTTHAYLEANYTLLLSARAHLRAGEAAPRKLLAALRHECPQAAHGSPQDENSTQVSDEVIGAMVIGAYRLDLPAIRRYVAAARRLRWRSSSLTRAVHAYAGQLRVLAALSPPPLCADIHAWAASGYRTLGAGTVQFDRRFMPNWVAIGLVPAGLARFEGAAERSIVRRSTAIESDISEAEARAVFSWGKITEELEVWP